MFRIIYLRSLLNQREETSNMGVEKVGEKYRCNICGNEVVAKVGGGVLVCCGEEMERIE